MADETEEKTDTRNTLEKTSDSGEKEREIRIEIDNGEGTSNNASKEHNSDTEKTIKSDNFSQEMTNVDNAESKTGFLRSFVDKKHAVQNLEVREPSLGCVRMESNDAPKTTKQTCTANSLCKWQDCDVVISSRSALSQHVHQSHVEPMVVQDVFVCLWTGCKVFNKPSCSHSWLSKHMNSHTGDKPFKCMIDGCSMSFSSCDGLSRHVAGHFNEPKAPKRQRGESKDSPKKPVKKRKMKVIRRRKPVEVKEDFVNPETVETIRKKLPTMMPLSAYEIGIDGTKIILHSKVLGKRINEKDGETDVLLHWSPDEVLPDEWIPLDDYERHKSKTIPISSLPNHVTADLDPAFYRRLSYRQHRRK